MDRRIFTRTSFAVAGAATLGAGVPAASFAQTPEGTATSGTPVASAGLWKSADDPVTIEFDAEIFGEAETTGVTGEWCVLRIEDIDRFLSMIIKLEDKYPHQEEAIRDYIENDPELSYEGQERELERISVVQDNGAFGVFYLAPQEGSEDTWAYTQMIPAEDRAHRTISVWVNSRRSKLDRELMEAAVSSVLINGEPAVRAMEVSDLFDEVEALEF